MLIFVEGFPIANTAMRQINIIIVQVSKWKENEQFIIQIFDYTIRLLWFRFHKLVAIVITIWGITNLLKANCLLQNHTEQYIVRKQWRKLVIELIMRDRNVYGIFSK